MGWNARAGQDAAGDRQPFERRNAQVSDETRDAGAPERTGRDYRRRHASRILKLPQERLRALGAGHQGGRRHGGVNAVPVSADAANGSSVALSHVSAMTGTVP